MLYGAVVKFRAGCGHNSALEILNYIIYRSRQFMRPYSITRRKLLPKVISPKVISTFMPGSINLGATACVTSRVARRAMKDRGEFAT